jgi:hypothetical protein
MYTNKPLAVRYAVYNERSVSHRKGVAVSARLHEPDGAGAASAAAGVYAGTFPARYPLCTRSTGRGVRII